MESRFPNDNLEPDFCEMCGSKLNYRDIIRIGGRVRRRADGRPFRLHPPGVNCRHKPIR